MRHAVLDKRCVVMISKLKEQSKLKVRAIVFKIILINPSIFRTLPMGDTIRRNVNWYSVRGILSANPLRHWPASLHTWYALYSRMISTLTDLDNS